MMALVSVVQCGGRYHAIRTTDWRSRNQIAPNRHTNAIEDLAAQAEVARWTGCEVTAACCVGEVIVCAALDGAVYCVSAGKVQALQHKEIGVCMQCLESQLAQYDLRSKELIYHALLPISKPKEMPVLLAHQGCLYVGAKEIYRGTPGHWTKVGDFEAGKIFALLPALDDPAALLAVGPTGRTKILRV